MPENPPNDVRLNDNQRRHYEVLFARLERSLTQLEEAATGAESRDLLTFSSPDLPRRYNDEALPIIQNARAVLADIVRALALSPRGVSRRRTCRALITSEMVRLEDSYAAHLRGYGPVDPSVGEHLDPLVTRLHSTMSQLGDLLRDDHGGPREI